MHSLRTAGIGLLVFGIGTLATMMSSNIPGGNYEPAKVTSYLAQGHALQSFVIGYLGLVAAIALLLFGQGIRSSLGQLGDFAWGLCIVGTATSMVGWFIGTGVVVATAEGGSEITRGVPLPVAHTIGEIAGLLGGCAPMLCAGVVGLLMSRTSLPRWLRGFGVVAALCGILAALFFTLFVFVLWTLVAGVWLIVRGPRADAVKEGARSESIPSLI